MKKNPVIPLEFIVPFVLITTLFGLWGFANAVTDPMVQAFKKVLELDNSQAAWVQMAFYGGYFSMALPAAIFVRKHSYKKGILLGLVLYAIGALLFYPAAILQEFWFFCLGLYILTFGLAFLETTANPYILAMGSKETATQRLNLAQAFNPVGLILGLLVAQQFVLKNLQSDTIDNFAILDEAGKTLVRTTDLLVIRNPYVLLGATVGVLAILMYFVKMPEFRYSGNRQNFLQTLLGLKRNSKYILGVIAQIFYVGIQIMCWTYIYQYAEDIGIHSTQAANYQYVAFLLFFIGRVFGTALLRYFSGGDVLAGFSGGGILAILGVIFINNVIGLYCLVGLSFFMSVMFPTIYSLALEDLQEDDMKIGAAGLVMAIVGGAILPKLQGLLIDIGGPGVHDVELWGISEVNLSFVLTLLSLIIIANYGIFCTRKKFRI